MEIENLSPEIQTLISEMHTYIDNYDKRVFKTLRKLEKYAKEISDHSFSGYVYHNLAGAYYDFNNHEMMFKYLKKALYELFRSNDRALIARTFNLFAIEAQSYGCFEVSYHYNQLASTFIANENDFFLKAIIKSNVGDLFADMGEPQKSCKYTKEALNLLKKCDIETVKQQIALVNINICLHNIYANNITDAKKSFRQLEKHLNKYALNDDPIINGWMILIKAQMARLDFDEKATNKYIEEIINTIITNESLPIYIKDIYYFSQALINNKDWKKVNKIISAIEERSDDKQAYFKYLLYELNISYYSAIGNKQKMMTSYHKKNELIKMHRQEENLIYYESIQLMKIVDELRREQITAKKENELLKQVSLTDSLTGIPNRNALNKELENTYVQAINEGHFFAIGILDIDAFKDFNDKYGHIAGDKCLIKVAKALLKIAEINNIFVARYGGDEFVLIFDNFSDQKILEIEKKIHKATEVSVSFGYYNAIPNENIRPWDFFSEADKKLYLKKRK